MTTMTRWVGLRWMALLGVLWFSASVAAASERPELTFGVVPQQSASTLARLWTPILAYLSERSGVEMRFATAPSIPAFEQRCAEGAYDIAYMNPYHFTVFQRSPGYRAFARQAGKRIQGLLVVRKDSMVESLDDLQGQRLAFPAPAAFAASVLPRAELVGQDIDFDARFVGSHDSVYRAVAKGLFAAGGGIGRTFANVAPEVRAQLRVLWRSREFTPHALAAHPRVGDEVIERVRAAMLGMANDPEGRALLETIKFRGIEAAQDADWDDVRALGIDTLERLIQG